MARPIYENEDDLANEEAVRPIIEKHLQVSLVKQPHSYQLDWLGLVGERIKCIVEVKCRNHASTTFDTLIVSALKIKAGMEWSEFFDKPFWLAARFDDGLFMVLVTKEKVRGWNKRYAGRTKQYRSEGDREVVIDVNVKEMMKIADAPQFVMTPGEVVKGFMQRRSQPTAGDGHCLENSWSRKGRAGSTPASSATSFKGATK